MIKALIPLTFEKNLKELTTIDTNKFNIFDLNCLFLIRSFLHSKDQKIFYKKNLLGFSNCINYRHACWEYSYRFKFKIRSFRYDLKKILKLIIDDITNDTTCL